MRIGFIGGSGLYDLGDSASGKFLQIDTPFGPPSGDIFCMETKEHCAYFLPRHGKGHRLLPSEVPYRANLFALKKLGVTTVISISAVGSLRKEISPGDFVLPDQYIDRTQGSRPDTFFGNGIVAHAHFADPACSETRSHIAGILEEMGVKFHVGGTYVCMEGPQFSTRSESHLYRSWDNEKIKISVIGMTALPEAKLARELGLCYQTVATSTDYDCWNEEHGDVSVQAILKTLRENVSASQKLISLIMSRPFPECKIKDSDLMKNAVVTSRDLWPEEMRETMEVILK